MGSAGWLQEVLAFLQYIMWDEESTSSHILNFVLEHITQSHYARVHPALPVSLTHLAFEF